MHMTCWQLPLPGEAWGQIRDGARVIVLEGAAVVVDSVVDGHGGGVKVGVEQSSQME